MPSMQWTHNEVCVFKLVVAKLGTTESAADMRPLAALRLQHALLTISFEPQIGTLKHRGGWAVGVASTKRLAANADHGGVSSGKDGPRAIPRELLLEIRARPPDARPEYALMLRLDRVGRGSIVRRTSCT